MNTRASFPGLVLLMALVAFGMAPGQDAQWAALNAQVTELSRTGQYDRAIVVGKKALAVAEEGGNQLFVATSLNSLAVLYHAQQQYAEAEPLYKRALEIREKVLGPESRVLPPLLSNLAELYRAQGQYEEAEPLYQRALAITEKLHGPDHPDVAMKLGNLANLYRAQSEYAKAEPLYKRALTILEKALGPDDSNVAGGLENYARMLKADKRDAEAEPLLQRAKAIRDKTAQRPPTTAPTP